MKTKRIRDPIYGFIAVDELDLGIIDHKLVQRLRWISQLPLEQLVYPSAQHSRFEHSLGVMHLSGIAAESLVNNSKKRFYEAAAIHDDFRPLRPARQKELFVRCARWAGLLHDLGHGPFSHTLEDACEYSAKQGSLLQKSVRRSERSEKVSFINGLVVECCRQKRHLATGGANEAR